MCLDNGGHYKIAKSLIAREVILRNRGHHTPSMTPKIIEPSITARKLYNMPPLLIKVMRMTINRIINTVCIPGITKVLLKK
jgi:hypothetical protein